MNKSRWPIFLLLIGLGLVSLVGFARLFVLRFQAGDIYPPYSSLRADPLGTKVLFDALHEAPGLAAERNFAPLNKIPHAENATIVYAGASESLWQVFLEPDSIDDAEHLETLARAGAHVIVAFLPQEKSAGLRESERAERPKAADQPKNRTEQLQNPSLTDLGDRWGFVPAFRQAIPGVPNEWWPRTPDGDAVALAVSTDTELELSWHTPFYFRKPDSAWRILYRCEGLPVLMQRTFGRGDMVVAADCFFLSNEAMRTERSPRLLASLLGSGGRVIFDETHLGVAENPGIATLIRKYNLEALLGAMGVLAALFAWQTASPFLPPLDDRDDEQIVRGKDSASGFVTFLRRGIPPSQLLEVCVEQWRKSGQNGTAKRGAMLVQMEVIVAVQGSREPVAAYQKISQTLAEKK